MFFKTFGGNNNGGRWPVLNMPILSSKSLKCHSSHSYNLTWCSSMLCIYKFNLCINVILPVTSGAICAIWSVYKSWPVKSFSICIVLFLRPFMVLTISCNFATLWLPYNRKSFSSSFREFHARDWSCCIAIKLETMALFLFLWRKEFKLSTAIVANPAIAGTKADKAYFLCTGVSLLVSCKNLCPAEAGSWKLLLVWECPEPCKDCGISSFKILLMAFS